MADLTERGGDQVIPRPGDWRPGSPAAWGHLSEGERHVDVDRLLRALRSAPPPVPLPAVTERRPSAVLVPVFEEEGEAWMVLTRRAQHMRNHRGEVSFPGGRQDEGEALVDTATREAREEIGLDPAHVEVVAELDHLFTISSGAPIVPFVGILPARPAQLTPNPDEVELILTLPFRELLREGTYHGERWNLWGEDREMAFFDVVGDTIWGATARILHDLLVRVVATA
ncbi:MAG: pyrophosphohydrolase [Actinomycetia bacterium]|nr:pyrophosphohydrolase [Actinomycetes bacterium]